MPSRDQAGNQVTIYDVAQDAKVSISTVSRVLNDSGEVAEHTRDRVLASVRKLEFHPNRTARRLAKRTETIVVAVPSFITPFHNDLLEGVRERLKDSDVDLLLCDLEWENPRQSLRQFLSRGSIDGLLVVGVSMDASVAEEIHTIGAPVVLIGASWPRFDSFYWDDEEGAQVATQHLLDIGHERIGMIATPHVNQVREDRIRGYRKALRSAGVGFDKSRIAYGRTKKHDGYSEEAGYEAMNDLLLQEPSVTAVFASSDVHAIGAWQAIRESGQQVPEDFALVGYDDIKVSRFIGLTSIAQNMYGVGRIATDRLLDCLQDSKDETINRQVATQLKVRASCERQ